jgi:hypothetical protein
MTMYVYYLIVHVMPFSRLLSSFHVPTHVLSAAVCYAITAVLKQLLENTLIISVIHAEVKPKTFLSEQESRVNSFWLHLRDAVNIRS